MNSTMQPSRRKVLTAAAFSFLPACRLGRRSVLAASEKVNIAVVGVGGRGSISLENLKDHNIVALCDVDWRLPTTNWPRAVKVAADYPNAKRYDDYRRMLDEMDKDIDAVVVATPDHTHAAIAMAAMKRRKHVYCEKPLAPSIQEIRALAAAAKTYKVATQMGNQGHSSEDTRRVVEWVRDGAIGTVKEARIVHIEGSGSTRESKLARIKETYSVPQGLNWDLWLGPAPYRPFHPMYLPQDWRDWRAFGTGRLGDYTCHLFDCISWALDLDPPDTIEASTDRGYDPKANNETYPNSATIRYRFPAKGERAPVTLTWHADEPLPDLPGFCPDAKPPTSGGVLIGTKGSLLFGPMYRALPDKAKRDMVRLYPDELDKSYRRPAQSIPRVKGHWAEWIECCKNGKQPGSNFSCGGALSEVGSLGNIAIQRKGTILEWNAKQCRFTNDDEANSMIRRKYRDGWLL